MIRFPALNKESVI